MSLTYAMAREFFDSEKEWMLRGSKKIKAALDFSYLEPKDGQFAMLYIKAPVEVGDVFYYKKQRYVLEDVYRNFKYNYFTGDLISPRAISVFYVRCFPNYKVGNKIFNKKFKSKVYTIIEIDHENSLYKVKRGRFIGLLRFEFQGNFKVKKN